MQETSIVYGYGFQVKEPTNLEAIRDVICDSWLEATDFLQEVATVTDYDEFNERFDCQFDIHAGTMIALYMENTYGIRFLYEPGDEICNSKPTVLFRAEMPWAYNAEEKKLDSVDTLTQMCLDTMDKFGIPIIDNEPDWVEVEYYG